MPDEPSPFFLPAPMPGMEPRRLGFGIRHLMALVLGFALLFWVGRSLGVGVVVWLAICLVVSLGIGAIVLLIRSSAGPREMMLWMISAASEKGLPLGPGIRSVSELAGGGSGFWATFLSNLVLGRTITRAAGGGGGGYSLRAAYLARLIDDGLSLPDALDRVPGLIPATAVVYTRMGWHGPVLARALREESMARDAQRKGAQDWSLRIAFLVWTLVVLQYIYAFMAYWIAPKFKEIFADFGVDLPALTRGMMWLTDTLVNSPLFPALLLAELVALPLLLVAFFDPMSWRVPLIDWWMLRRHGGAVARVLAVEIESGRPIASSFRLLAEQYPGSLVRGRLDRVSSEVDRGEPWIDALGESGLVGGAGVDLMKAADRAGNLPWALRELAASAERRFSRRVAAIGQIVFPLVILVVATVVGLYAVAYFLPLIQLIEVLAR
jgi:protein transport protein HofC